CADMFSTPRGAVVLTWELEVEATAFGAAATALEVMLLKNASYPMPKPARKAVFFWPISLPRIPESEDGAQTRPATGPKLFLSGFTLFGAVKGLWKVTGSTLKIPM